MEFSISDFADWSCLLGFGFFCLYGFHCWVFDCYSCCLGFLFVRFSWPGFWLLFLLLGFFVCMFFIAGFLIAILVAWVFCLYGFHCWVFDCYSCCLGFLFVRFSWPGFWLLFLLLGFFVCMFFIAGFLIAILVAWVFCLYGFHCWVFDCYSYCLGFLFAIGYWFFINCLLICVFSNACYCFAAGFTILIRLNIVFVLFC